MRLCTFLRTPFRLYSRSTAPLPFPFHLLLSSQTPDLRSLCRHHGLIVAAGHSTNPFFSAKLIALYAAFNRPDLADKVFAIAAAAPSNQRDTFLWNSVVKCHFARGNFALVLRLYHGMLSSGAPLNEFTVPMVVSSSAELLDAGLGSCIHGSATKFGLFPENSVGVGSSLVYMYSKCGAVGDAARVFDEMTERDVVSWTAVIVGCVRNGEHAMGLYRLAEMHHLGGGGGGARDGWLNSRIIEAGLQACGSLGEVRKGKCLHGYTLKSARNHCDSIKSSLLSMYSKCESLEDVVLTFGELLDRDVISWTEMVSVYAKKGCISKCLDLFSEMQASGLQPDGVFISCMLAGFANANSVFEGKAFHCVILRRGFGLNKLVTDALISMYIKFALLDPAQKIFELMDDLDAWSLNLMVIGYGKVGQYVECLNAFRKMQFLCLSFDSNSLISVLSSCSELEALHLGKSIHCYTLKGALDKDVSVANALIVMYGRCGKLHLSRRVFDHTSRDVVSWNALIASYVHLGYTEDALTLFTEMFLEDVTPNSITLLSVISACSHIAALSLGKWIHNYMKEMGLDHDATLCTALVDMYAKCGQLELSRATFESMPERDVVSWNVMISGYGMHGNAEEALKMFREMESIGVKPNDITFLAVLSACSHGGLVKEGKLIFDKMNRYSISPSIKHYTCMVDLLGRSGNLSEAENMVGKMPIEPDHGIWGALLGACNLHNNVAMGERIANRAFVMGPENDGHFVVMSNMYGSVGRWKDVEMLRGSMNNKLVKKQVAWSSLELMSGIHVFTVGDMSHSDSKEILFVLESLSRQTDGLARSYNSYVSSTSEIAALGWYINLMLSYKLLRSAIEAENCTASYSIVCSS